jgi:hypothetical protein
VRSWLFGACLTTGCSFIFVTPPRTHVEQDSSPCTATYVPPTLDVVFTGYQVVRTARAVDASDAQYEGAAISRQEDIAFGVSLAVLGAASMAYGYWAVSRCNDATAPPPAVRRGRVECVSNAHCAPGYRCVAFDDERLCLPPPPRDCRTDDDCPPEQRCVTETRPFCAPREPPGNAAPPR